MPSVRARAALSTAETKSDRAFSLDRESARRGGQPAGSFFFALLTSRGKTGGSRTEWKLKRNNDAVPTMVWKENGGAAMRSGVASPAFGFASSRC